MTGTAGDGSGASGRLATLLTGAASDAARAAGGRTAGVFLRSRTPGLLRLAALSGLPGELFRPWWRLHTDRPFPVTDAHRLSVAVLLPNPAESMRRYPQFAAGLPFPFGSLSVPVATDTEPYGVVTVLRPSVPDLAGLVAPRERLAQVADGLAAALHELEDDGIAARWDDPPTCVHPPPAGPSRTQPGSITWEPGADRLTLDPRARALLGLDADGTLSTLLSAVAAEDARRLAALLREASHGRPPPLPVPVHTTDGMLRLLHLWTAQDEVPFGPAPHRVGGAVLEPGPALPADAAADLLPEGVFCLDRLGVVVYANTRAALLLDVARDRLLGRPLWEAVPWLVRPGHEDHLRGAMLSPETVRFHAQRPSPDGAGPHRADGDWLALSIHPGPDLLACTVVPAASMADTPTLTDAEEAAPAWQPDGAAPAAPEAQPTDNHLVPPPESASVTLAYRPIVLAIALTEAVTARQVSAVVVQELLPAFGGRPARHLSPPGTPPVSGVGDRLPTGLPHALRRGGPGRAAARCGDPDQRQAAVLRLDGAARRGLPGHTARREGGRAGVPAADRLGPPGRLLHPRLRAPAQLQHRGTHGAHRPGRADRARHGEGSAVRHRSRPRPRPPGARCCRAGCPRTPRWRRRAAISRAPKAWTSAATGTTSWRPVTGWPWSSGTSRGTACRPRRQWASCAARSARSH
ncbi:hypothetical protein GCM10020256_03140 [Streptomyces thermocoprophilus]